MKAFINVLNASAEDNIFSAEVEAMINYLEDAFDEHGSAAILAALICATHHAKANSAVTEDEFMEYVRSIYRQDYSREKSS